jgi:hypothetical protein
MAGRDPGSAYAAGAGADNKQVKIIFTHKTNSVVTHSDP